MSTAFSTMFESTPTTFKDQVRGMSVVTELNNDNPKIGNQEKNRIFLSLHADGGSPRKSESSLGGKYRTILKRLPL